MHPPVGDEGVEKLQSKWSNTGRPNIGGSGFGDARTLLGVNGARRYGVEMTTAQGATPMSDARNARRASKTGRGSMREKTPVRRWQFCLLEKRHII